MHGQLLGEDGVHAAHCLSGEAPTCGRPPFLCAARNVELEGEVREQQGQLRSLRVDMQGTVAELEQVSSRA